jgi:hypothetical protein
MRNFRSTLCLMAAATLFSAGACRPLPALADHSVSVGYFAPTPGQKNVGLIATTGLTLPVVPIAPQLAIAVPFSGGRYAVTGEGRISLHGTTLGAGVGIARLSTHGSTGTIWDGFIAHPIAPDVSVEARYYGFGSNNNGSTGYIGLKLGLP